MKDLYHEVLTYCNDGGVRCLKEAKNAMYALYLTSVESNLTSGKTFRFRH